MNQLHRLLPILAFAAFPGCAREEPPPPAPGGGVTDASPLFDGRSLAGWTTTDGAESWGVEEGGILALKIPGGGHVATAAAYDDFELRLEFRLDSGADSGIFFRWSEGAPPEAALQIELTDSGGRPPDVESAGALAGAAAATANPVRPGGEWNDLKLVCEGPRIRTWVNGQETLDVDLGRWTEPGKNPDGTANRHAAPLASMPRRGRIGFENGRFFAWYRNLWLRPLRVRG